MRPVWFVVIMVSAYVDPRGALIDIAVGAIGAHIPFALGALIVRLSKGIGHAKI